ncbi:uncharacterized protein LOC129945575 [Eupeodes corollae]|uniref:uncharacterized protein LOC129945575 n=1 Tax=Eupeodes corollae TaxID=290404 RepID=UPI002491E0F1|nr:uncharacterized protein LOC129945575 [Eupeodes corollae]
MADANRKFKRLCYAKRVSFENLNIAVINNTRSSSEFWKAVKHLNGKINTIALGLQASDLRDYFISLLNRSANGPLVQYAAPSILDEYLDAPFSIQEVKEVVANAKLNKAPGDDRIPFEFFKHATEKCSYEDPANYRGISFLNTCAKLFAGLIHNRLSKWVEDKNILSEFQSGFRKSYSTIDHIFSLLNIADLYKRKQKKLYAFFIDFRAAFDSVDRQALFYKLSVSGVSSKVINVWDGESISEEFATVTGLKQGCILSALLFIIFINDITDEVRGGITVEGLTVPALMYADDIVLFSETVDGMQLMINRLEIYCNRWNLEVNLQKSKMMIFRVYLNAVTSFEEDIILRSKDNRDLLVQCSYKLVKKYFFSGETLSGSVLTVSLTSPSPDLQSQMLLAFHSDQYNPWSIVLRDSRHSSSSKASNKFILHEKPQSYFVVIETADDEDMEDIFEDWKSMPNWNPLAQFVVMLASIEETEEEMTELMVDTMLIFMSRKIYNINIIAQTEEDGRVYSKTAFPYEPDNNCGSRIIAFETLDICQYEEDNDGDDDDGSRRIQLKQQNRGLFLDKIPKHLSGCPLLAYARSWEPYIFVEDNQMKGIEWMLVQAIAESLHIQIKILIQNKTLYHIFQGLIDGKIDIVIGGIDEDPNLSQFVSASVPYLQDDLTWCVARAKRTLNWLNFVEVFTPESYATYLSFIITNALAIFMIQKSPSIPTKLCNSFFGLVFILIGIALSQTPQEVYLKASLRICILMSLAAAVILGSTYNSFLVSSLTSPNTLPQVKKIAQIVDHKMSVTGSVEIIRHLDKDGSIFKYIRREFSMCYNLEECLQRAAKDCSLAVAISRQYSTHNPRIPRDNLYCFDRDQHIYTYLVTMLMPKKFHLYHQINPIIQYIIESGHLLKWTRDLEQQRMLKAIKRELVNDENRVMKLEVGQILGILACTLIFLGVALFVFVLENFVCLMIKRGSKAKVIKVLHKHFSN